MKFYLVIFFKDGGEARYPMPAVEQLNFFWNNIEKADVTGIGVYAEAETEPSE
jgi:hypothetical protein